MEGVRATGRVAGGLGKNKQLVGQGSGVCPSAFTPAAPGIGLVSPVLNTVALPKTSW